MKTITVLAQAVMDISEQCETLENQVKLLENKLKQAEQARDDYNLQLKMLGRKK